MSFCLTWKEIISIFLNIQTGFLISLNNAVVPQYSQIVDISLDSCGSEYKEKPWNFWVDSSKYETKSKTFNFKKNKHLYTVPIIEIVRIVLAPSNFLLNRILEMDSFENYFTYTVEAGKLDIHFTSEYPRALLKEDKINHLAWILTNPNVLRMFNALGQSIWQYGEMKFDFKLDNFNIRAKVEDKGTYTRILEIISLRRKRINVEEINIYHPYFEESKSSDKTKIRKYVNRKLDNDRRLTNSVDGSTKEHEEIDTKLITHEYEKMPTIHRKKNGSKIVRRREDENTKTYIFDDNNLRSTADSGGEELVRGLEFITIDKVEAKGELEEFIEILKLLEKKLNIKAIHISIGELPDGNKGKRFARLSDGITRRKYAIGRIIMVDSRVYCIFEIEREDKALSTLILKAERDVNWDLIYKKLLLGLVDASGTWSNSLIEKVQEKAILVKRNKHIKKLLNDKVKFIYGKITSF